MQSPDRPDDGLVYNHAQALQQVQRNGMYLRFASKELRGNREIVLAAVRENAHALEYATKRLRKNRDFALAVIPEYHHDEEDVRRHFNNDPHDPELIEEDEYFLLADKIDDWWHFMEQLGDNLRNDYHVVMAAVKMSGAMLPWASHRLRTSRSIVLASIKDDTTWAYTNPLECTGIAVRGNAKTMLQAVAIDFGFFVYASKALHDNHKFMISVAMAADDTDDVQYVLGKASRRLRKNTFFIRAIKVCIHWNVVSLLFLGNQDSSSILSLLPIEVVRQSCLPALLDTLTIDEPEDKPDEAVERYERDVDPKKEVVECDTDTDTDDAYGDTDSDDSNDSNDDDDDGEDGNAFDGAVNDDSDDSGDEDPSV